MVIAKAPEQDKIADFAACVSCFTVFTAKTNTGTSALKRHSCEKPDATIQSQPTITSMFAPQIPCRGSRKRPRGLPDCDNSLADVNLDEQSRLEIADVELNKYWDLKLAKIDKIENLDVLFGGNDMNLLFPS